MTIFLALRRHRLALLVAAGAFAVALLVAVLGAAFVLMERTRTSVSWVEHTFEVSDWLAALRGAVKDAETGQRGFLITADESYLEPYSEGLAKISPLIDRIRQETLDNPNQQARLPRLRALIDEKLSLLSSAIDLARVGRHDEGRQIVLSDRGKIVMDDIRLMIEEMRSEESRLLDQRRKATDIVSERVRISIIVATVGAFLFTGVAAFGAWRAMRELRLAHDKTLAEMSSRETAESQLRQLQKLEALGQLTGGIAHDFNNMMAVILGGLELARRRLLPGQPEVLKFIDGAVEGAQRAAKLTAQLLAYSRQQPLMPEVISPNAIVAQMAEMLRRTIPENIEVQTVGGAGLWNTRVDPHQLQSALLNLCLNARDAMPEGGRLTIETSNAFVDESYATEHQVAVGQYVQMAVTDTGHGMPPETVARAFDPFFTTKPVGKGTGLGLSQILGFIRQSGGHVKIYSELGSGTTVKVYLPRSQETEEIRVPPPPVKIPRGRPEEVILLVEDEDRMNVVNTSLLRDLGYTVIHRDRPQAALSALEAHGNVALLFTDVVMPEMSGRVLADEAKRRRPDLKVLYTTGYTRNAIVHNGIVDSDALLLVKPFTLEQLATQIRTAIDG
jgi:signal transduction histidine kinase